jgi:NTE family protein
MQAASFLLAEPPQARQPLVRGGFIGLRPVPAADAVSTRREVRSSVVRGLQLVHPAPPRRQDLRMLPELLGHLPALRSLFEGLDRDSALEVENALEWVDLPAGETLFMQGDAAPDAFVVTAGHLAVVMGAGASRRTVARICPGEVVGEMALLADAPRSATVVALHDSYLIRLPRRAFDVLMEGAPDARRYLFRVLTSRLQHTSSGGAPAVAAEKIAIIPLGPVESVKETLEWLAHKVSPIIIGSACQEDRWDHGGAAAGRKVVYMANNHHSDWARRCIDQADRVIFVASVNSGAVGVDVVAAAARLEREMSLVLVNRREAAVPTGAEAWLSHFPHSQILHVRQADTTDYERVLRLISRSSVCMVLSGGGARALAHIGAIQALEEEGMPIDAIAGTSMGALIAALAAKGVRANEIHSRMRRHLIENNPIKEYTLPFVSLVRGRKLTRMFQEACEEARVENLWRTFFCVSADLTTGAPVIHRSGPLWRALRASSAIPGLFPPVMDEGQVLVDGAIVDNMPTAAMRSLNRGSVIGVDVSSASTLAPCDVAIEQKSWLWLLMGGRNKAPSMAQVLMSSGMIGSGSQRSSARAAADLLVEPCLDGVGVLSFSALDKAVEAGYHAMKAAIPKLRLAMRPLSAAPCA